MNELTHLLKSSALFRDLSEDTIESRLLPLGNLQEYTRGSFLILPQEQLDSFGLVISGAVHTVHISIDGDSRIMDAWEAGDFYGIDLMCTRSRLSPYHAMAAQNSRVLLFPVAMVLEPGSLPETDRQNILRRLLTIIAHENMRKDYRLAILSQKGLRERIMTYLTMQAGKRGTATFTIPFSREELASFLCVNRSALSHELTLMRRDGLIRCRKSSFTLLHWEAQDIF